MTITSHPSKRGVLNEAEGEGPRAGRGAENALGDHHQRHSRHKRPPHRPCGSPTRSERRWTRIGSSQKLSLVTMGFRVASVPKRGIIVASCSTMIFLNLRSVRLQARMAIETEIVPIPRVRHSPKGTISYYAWWMLVIRDPTTEHYSEEFYRTRKAAVLRRDQLMASGAP